MFLQQHHRLQTTILIRGYQPVWQILRSTNTPTRDQTLFHLPPLLAIKSFWRSLCR